MFHVTRWRQSNFRNGFNFRLNPIDPVDSCVIILIDLILSLFLDRAGSYSKVYIVSIDILSLNTDFADLDIWEQCDTCFWFSLGFPKTSLKWTRLATHLLYLALSNIISVLTWRTLTFRAIFRRPFPCVSTRYQNDKSRNRLTALTDPSNLESGAARYRNKYTQDLLWPFQSSPSSHAA